MLHLQTIAARFSAADQGFPFSVPAIASLATLPLTTPVTFFIGENGSGKSTLLEAVACAAQSIAVGSEGVERDRTLDSVQRLAKQLKLAWSKKTRRGFFMRSEDFFGYAKNMQAMREDMARDLESLDADPSLSPTARAYGRLPYAGSLAALEHSYGAGLDTYSHGESFFSLFRSRFMPNGLYLLDEPEAPLSPMRQLSLIAMLKTMVAEQNSQFIIATHSPILMAFPGATIYSFDHGRIQPIAYDQIEHVIVTRDFLSDPQRFLRQL